MEEDKHNKTVQSKTFPSKDKWANIITVIGSPLKMFSLIILVCSTVFSISAAISGVENNFKYTIHMFLGVVGAFILIALWCPKLLYHPNELDEETVESMVHKPLIPTILIAIGTFIYFCYQVGFQEIIGVFR